MRSHRRNSLVQSQWVQQHTRLSDMQGTQRCLEQNLPLPNLISCPFSSLTPELPSIPSEYAGLVVRRILEPVLQGLHGLPPQAQAPALSQALNAILGAWLDHILSHGIRFR